MIDEQVKVKLKEALIDSDDNLFRSLGVNKHHKDLPSFSHEEMLRRAFKYYDTNTFARRIIELDKDFVIGDGFSYSANKDADEIIQEILDGFWNDSVNLLNLKQHNKVLELALFGEQCYPVSVNESNGHVTLGYIDPLSILSIKTDPKNIEVALQVEIKAKDNGTELLDIIREDDNPNSINFGKLVGDCFYFTVNKVSNATRGRSDLLTLFDWVDAHDQMAFDRVEKSTIGNSFVWDITMQNATNNEIRDFLNDPVNRDIPPPGSMRVHNEKVKWEAVSPNLMSSDAAQEIKIIKNVALGGAGIPEHWFAEGGDVNRATAAEMSEPVLKRLKTRQTYIKYMFEFIGKFVLDQFFIATGIKSDNKDNTFSVLTSDISIKDTKVAAIALKDTVMSTTLAVQSGIMSTKRAIELVNIVSQMLDDNVTAKEESEEINKQKQNIINGTDNI